MKKQYKVLISNTAVFAIGTIFIKLISFFLMPIYTSVLSTTDYGIAELLNNTIEIVLPLATICIIEALFRFSMDENVDHTTLFSSSLLVIFFGDIVVGICCLLWYYILDYRYALHFLLLYVTATSYKAILQFSRGLGHVKRYVTYGVLNSLLLVASNLIFLVKLRWGISAYLFSFSISYGIASIVAFIVSQEYKFVSIKKINLNTLKEMTKYSLPSIPNLLSWWVNSLSDRYILLWICGPAVAGLYTAASKLPAMINLVTSVFQQAWQYSTAKEVDNKGSKNFFSNVFRVYSYSCFSICAFLLILNKLICKVLLQSEFYYAWKYVPILLLAATFGGIGTYYGTFYNAVKNNKMLMISTLIGAIFNVILNFSLIPFIGAFGAAIATVISYFIVMIVRMIDVRSFIELEISKKRFFTQLLLLLLSSIFGCFEMQLSSIIVCVCFIAIIFSDIKLLKEIKHK